MEVWEEPVRGGYPPPWAAALSGEDRNEIWEKVSPIPPLSHLTGCRPVDFGDGESRSEMPASPWLLSPQGRIPLGALAILADLAFGTCYGPSLPPGGGFTTAELSLTRVRESGAGGTLVGEGRVIHAGDTSVLTEARVLDGEGHLVAAGTSRLAVIPPPPELPDIPDPLPIIERPTYDTPDPWERPAPAGVLQPSDWEGRTGREILQAQIDGELPYPPISALTGVRVQEVGDGRASVALPCSPWLTTPAGTVQGGVTALIADCALACAVQTTMDRGDSFLPLDIKVNYLRPVFGDGRPLTATAELTHRGRSLAIAHATVHNADGKPVALATGSAALTRG